MTQYSTLLYAHCQIRSECELQQQENDVVFEQGCAPSPRTSERLKENCIPDVHNMALHSLDPAHEEIIAPSVAEFFALE